MLFDRRAAIIAGTVATSLALMPILPAFAATSLTPADRLAIGMVLARYTWGVDTLDAGEAMAAFAPDATVRDIDGKLWQASNGGLSAFIQQQIAAATPGAQHHVQINRIAADRGDLLVESYWSLVAWRSDAPRPTLEATGAFTDTMVRRSDRWLIGKRVVSLWHSATVSIAPVEAPAP